MRPLLLLLLAAAAALPQRVVSLSSPQTETLYALGARDQVVGVSTTCVFPEQVLTDRRSGKLREVGDFTQPDLAAILSLRPDLVVTSTTLQRKTAEQLRAQGLRVLHFEPESLEQVFAGMEQLGAAVNRRAAAHRLVSGLRREWNDIARRTAALSRVRVYLEVNHNGPWTTGRRSHLQDLIAAAGGDNLFADHDGGLFVAEHAEIVRRNPEIILSPIWLHAELGGWKGITTLFEICARPGYAQTAAVERGRVLYYDSALLKHEGPRQVLAIRKLAHLLHPAEFPDPPPGTIPWELGRIR